MRTYLIEKETKIPGQSTLKSEENLYHYIDSYHGWLTIAGDNTSLKECTKLFISAGPKWVDFLMFVRDKVVGLFGLKTSGQITDQDKHIDNIKMEVGEQLGIFELVAKTENEIIIGGDDKHLNFRVSLYLEPLTDATPKRELIITTCVKFNNLFGKLYFIPVKPFHGIIVYRTLKNIIKELESKSKTNM